jgi:hypothetical protein
LTDFARKRDKRASLPKIGPLAKFCQSAVRLRCNIDPAKEGRNAMTKASSTQQDETKVRRWLQSVIEQSTKPENRIPWSRQELKAQWREAANRRASMV